MPRRPRSLKVSPRIPPIRSISIPIGFLIGLLPSFLRSSSADCQLIVYLPLKMTSCQRTHSDLQEAYALFYIPILPIPNLNSLSITKNRRIDISKLQPERNVPRINGSIVSMRSGNANKAWPGANADLVCSPSTYNLYLNNSLRRKRGHVASSLANAWRDGCRLPT